MTAPQRYRRLPTVIEAVQWQGDKTSFDTIHEWTAGQHPPGNTGSGFLVLPPDLRQPPEEWSGVLGCLWVAANQTYVPVPAGQWVAKDSQGFYPIMAEQFAETYEPEVPAEDPVTSHPAVRVDCTRRRCNWYHEEPVPTGDDRAGSGTTHADQRDKATDTAINKALAHIELAHP
ncbi:hypothetical protein D1871_11025 [Nakamurella silvestris]|nr:hypothetical protein D1871_11025 [Nakamurella silvestris]